MPSTTPSTRWRSSIRAGRPPTICAPCSPGSRWSCHGSTPRSAGSRMRPTRPVCSSAPEHATPPSGSPHRPARRPARTVGRPSCGEAMSKSDELAAAVESGRLSTDKANAAIGAAGDLAVDHELLDEIAAVPLAGVRPATESWRSRHDAERDQDVAASQRARRSLRLTGQADGMTRVEGMLDPESASIVRTTLDSIISASAFDDSHRTRDQRCADALAQLAKAASKGEIRGGRSNAKLLATVPFDTVVERAHHRGVTHAGPTLDADTVRRLACDAGIHRVITGPASSILDFGRETRLVSENLFLALVARDQHCRWPGCTIHATWCDAHHIVEWLDGGRTNESTCRAALPFPPLGGPQARLDHQRRRARVRDPPTRRHHGDQQATGPTEHRDGDGNGGSGTSIGRTARSATAPCRPDRRAQPDDTCLRPGPTRTHLTVRSTERLVALDRTTRRWLSSRCRTLPARPAHSRTRRRRPGRGHAGRASSRCWTRGSSPSQRR